MYKLRGIRGAVRVKENCEKEIISATRKLLLKMTELNDIKPDDIASIFFTATSDLDAEFPAYATRGLGYDLVPLLCAREMEVPKGMSRLIRILIHVNTDKSQENIRHQYLGETSKLRPELCGGNDDDRSDEN
ncbi:MAG: chorismate mutase [Candidatus Zixiibacteriota bacterium]|nr:MAG: chorismate mutase [candidate division Zixibacteria bacterium]HHI03150.1 chorismate mutase [candidate division Zixibacteria bacterium]